MGTWQVRPHTEGWRVLTPGGTRACAPADTQQDAIAAAMGLLVYEGGELLVHSEAGGAYRVPVGASRPASVHVVRCPYEGA